MVDSERNQKLINGSEVLLSFLKQTKEGIYAPIREENLCFVRIKETSEYNELLEEEFYYGIK